MYRAQDLGTVEALIDQCLQILDGGDPKEIRTILPHVSIVRSVRFKSPLLSLLTRGDWQQREMAALALGSLGDRDAIPALRRLLCDPRETKGEGSEALQTAVVLALGDICHEDSVKSLAEAYRMKNGRFGQQRKYLVLSSLGLLAQQGCQLAEVELTRLLEESDLQLRSEALSELAASYWNRPQEVPQSLIVRMVSLAQGPNPAIQETAASALASLADLGCPQAEEFFSGRRRA